MQKVNVKPHIVFEFFKFKISDSLIGWEPMLNIASPKLYIFAASVDI